MKLLIFISFLCFPAFAFGQVVNPTVIYQDTDIALHFTDVYYCPFAPPDSMDVAWKLSCIGSMDSDGIQHDYYPRVYDTATHGFIQLNLWHPCGDSAGDTIGNQVPWQRLFTAMDKPSGAHSDIIAGGLPGDSVIISANEDVDFRATGIIKLENGFRAKPGCFFHAYIAPKFETTVFSDEFNDTAKFNNQWMVGNKAHGFDGGADCSFDSNYALVPDSEAEDGWALRLDLKEDSCQCDDVSQAGSACLLDSGSSPTRYTFQFSTATLASCPFPFNGRTDPIKPAYQNAPYGKYEVREKVPIVEHHTQTYGNGQGDEFNLGEKVNGGLTEIHVGVTRRFQYGPFRGRFGRLTISGVDTGVFYSSAAHFTLWNKPDLIIINGFPYQVQINMTTSPTYPSYPADTILYANATTSHEGGFPSSLIADSTDSVTFYYTKVANGNASDPLAWSVDSTGRYFTGAYGLDGHGDTLFFNKGYQPTAIYLSLPPIKYNCHWDHHTGKILLTDTMSPSASHSGYGFTYDCDEGPAYSVPPLAVDTSTYKYHTYTMELYPHEAEFLIDGAVRFRFPDRLLPKSDPRYDYVTKMPRTPMNISSLAEIGIDHNNNYVDPLGLDTTGSWNGNYKSITYQERHYFETHDTTCHGCWPIDGQPAAHHMVDYIKVWDLPSDMIVPKFPQ